MKFLLNMLIVVAAIGMLANSCMWMLATASGHKLPEGTKAFFLQNFVFLLGILMVLAGFWALYKKYS